MNSLIATIRRHRNALTTAHQAHSRLVELDPLNPATNNEYAQNLRQLADACDTSRLVRWFHSHSTPAEMRAEAALLDPTRSQP